MKHWSNAFLQYVCIIFDFKKHDVVYTLLVTGLSRTDPQSPQWEATVLLALKFHRQRIAVGLSEVLSQEPNINQHCQPCSVTFLASSISSQICREALEKPSNYKRPKPASDGFLTLVLQLAPWDLLITHKLPIASRNHIISSKFSTLILASKQVGSSLLAC